MAGDGVMECGVWYDGWAPLTEGIAEVGASKGNGRKGGRKRADRAYARRGNPRGFRHNEENYERSEELAKLRRMKSIETKERELKVKIYVSGCTLYIGEYS